MTITDEDYLDLLANIKAIDLIVRGLFAKWAGEADDPRASAQRMISSMIESLYEGQGASGELEQVMLPRIEEHLRFFGDQIETRLRGDEN